MLVCYNCGRLEVKTRTCPRCGPTDSAFLAREKEVAAISAAQTAVSCAETISPRVMEGTTLFAVNAEGSCTNNAGCTAVSCAAGANTVAAAATAVVVLCIGLPSLTKACVRTKQLCVNLHGLFCFQGFGSYARCELAHLYSGMETHALMKGGGEGRAAKRSADACGQGCQMAIYYLFYSRASDVTFFQSK